MGVRAGYKQTEVGVIPEDWDKITLENISSFITKGTTPTTYGFKWESHGVLFLRSECVSENGLDLNQSMYISKEAHRVLKRSQVKDGDILITITGNVGRVLLIKDVGTANLNQHIARVRIVSSEIDARYIYHYLSQHSVRDYYESITTGQAYPQISLAQVRNTLVPLPPKAEQEAIAEALSDADGLIESLVQLIAKKRQLKQGTMQELLTGKRRLPGFEVKAGYKQTEVGVIPEDWEVGTLSKFADFLSSKRIFEHDYVSTGIPFLRGKEVTQLIENKSLSESLYISEAKYNKIKTKYGVPQKGDILITAVGTLGNVYTVPNNNPFYFKDGNLIWLKSISGIDINYFAIQIRNNRQTIIDNAIGSSQKALTIIVLKATVISFPPTKAEQKAIASIFSDMDAEIEQLEQKLTKARKMKQGMMQELLTGRIRLV
ncbi:restriction endonuclease subunit S [Maridesulfovibrio sp.]|uniref:restriction endonuclease subunit S n=1 Tax=unclassified Maridesulfovibrio TaxID=2794999 RepID=UPI003B003A05